MRIVFAVVFFLCALPAFAGGGAQQDCTLENTEFCATWRDPENYKMTITGDKVIGERPDAVETCTTLKEARFDDGRPLSLIKCTVPTHVIGYSFQIGYMLVMLPQDEIDRRINAHWVRMCLYHNNNMKGSCFSHDPVKRRSCDLAALFVADNECHRHGYMSLSGPG